ncbi:MAG: hypothetical protein CMI01_06595 [Oceanospirillaceae bacterium]|nr:hypothetical protein [Oceanospirillaceae bacterium]
MNRLPIKNIHAVLSEAVPDQAVGISLAHLSGDDAFSLYATEIPPGKRLTAHFHQQGDELYQVIKGKGLLWTVDAKASPAPEQQGPATVVEGDTFIIPPLTVHQLMNPGPEPLVMVFGCPTSHVTTDRQLVENLVAENTGGL